MSEQADEAPKALSMNVESLDIGLVVPGSSPVLSLDFHRAGEYLLTASEDGTVHLINALEGKARKKVYCKKYGVGVARFTHHEQSILCASRPSTSASDVTAHEIRYLSLYDNQYVRFFTGHQGRVTSLSMSYTDDRFLSGSVDGTIRLWTLQQPKCLGMANIQAGAGHPTLVSYDSEGLVFAGGAYIKERHLIKLYDARNYTQGAFETFSITAHELNTALTQSFRFDPQTAWHFSRSEWVGLEFSPDGKYLLISTKSGMTLVVDAFELQIKRVITGYTNQSQLDITASYSPDCGHIFTGSEDGDVCVYDASETRKTDAPILRLKGHTGPVRQVICNPKYEVVASACSNTILWIPK